MPKTFTYINSNRFEADEETMDDVVKTLEDAGWTYSKAGRGYVKPKKEPVQQSIISGHIDDYGWGIS